MFPFKIVFLSRVNIKKWVEFWYLKKGEKENISYFPLFQILLVYMIF